MVNFACSHLCSSWCYSKFSKVELPSGVRNNHSNTFPPCQAPNLILGIASLHSFDQLGVDWQVPSINSMQHTLRALAAKPKYSANYFAISRNIIQHPLHSRLHGHNVESQWIATHICWCLGSSPILKLIWWVIGWRHTDSNCSIMWNVSIASVCSSAHWSHLMD